MKRRRGHCWGLGWRLPVLAAALCASCAPAGQAGPGEPFFQDLLKVYTPRQACMLSEQPVVWLHLVADLLSSPGTNMSADSLPGKKGLASQRGRMADPSERAAEPAGSHPQRAASTWPGG